MVRCGGGKRWLKVIDILRYFRIKLQFIQYLTRLTFSPLNIKADVGRNPKSITGEKYPIL